MSASPSTAEQSAEDDAAEHRTAEPAATASSHPCYTAQAVRVPIRPDVLLGEVLARRASASACWASTNAAWGSSAAASDRAFSQRRWASARRVRASLPTAPRCVVM
ncbi:hypothetical protein STANM309S_06214 [Streptomyces tanashiensis]